MEIHRTLVFTGKKEMAKKDIQENLKTMVELVKTGNLSLSNQVEFLDARSLFPPLSNIQMAAWNKQATHGNNEYNIVLGSGQTYPKESEPPESRLYALIGIKTPDWYAKFYVKPRGQPGLGITDNERPRKVEPEQEKWVKKILQEFTRETCFPLPQSDAMSTVQDQNNPKYKRNQIRMLRVAEQERRRLAEFFKGKLG